MKYYCKLKDSAAFRHEEQSFVAEGLKLCLDIAAHLTPSQVFFTEHAQETATTLSGEAFCVTESVAQKLSDVRAPQGLFCVFPMPQIVDNALEDGSWLLLDRVQDPANVGAMLRSAAAFGYRGAALSSGSADVFSPKALRASMGAAVKLHIIENCDFAKAIPLLKSRGALTLAACLEDSVPLHSISHGTRSTALLIGNEGQGVSEAARALCEACVRIPIAPAIESLNAAVAASVLLWHFRESECGNTPAQ